MDIPTHKTCTKCGELKVFTDYYVNKTCKYGLATYCKVCTYELAVVRRKKRAEIEPDYKGTKKCPDCQGILPKTKFHHSYHTKDRLSTYCKMCALKKSKISSCLPVSYVGVVSQLEPYGVECREDGNDKLEVKCHYSSCKKWYKPTRQDVSGKIKAIKGHGSIGAQNNLYCSEWCKYKCPTFSKQTYREGENPNEQAGSRVHQAELKSILIEERGNTCEKCGTTPEILIMHHIIPVADDGIISLDKDNCILLCNECEKMAHSKDGCGYNEISQRQGCTT